VSDESLWRISDWSLTALNARISSPFITATRPELSHQVEQLIVLCYSVGCHGNREFSNLLPGNNSFIAIRCNGNVIPQPLLSSGRLLGCTIPAFSRHVTVYLTTLSVVQTASILLISSVSCRFVPAINEYLLWRILASRRVEVIESG
jgi:hypothetical protein